MSDVEPDTAELLSELTRELRRIQHEVTPERRSFHRDIARFTSEVAIPALILMLKTNIQMLELLRRTIRIAEGREPSRERGTEMRKRAEQLGQVTLSRLDEVLVELQTAVEGRPNDDRTQQLIDDARALREQIQDEFEGESTHEGVSIDVEEELRALKDNLDDETAGSGDGASGDGPDDSTRGDADTPDDER